MFDTFTFYQYLEVTSENEVHITASRAQELDANASIYLNLKSATVDNNGTPGAAGSGAQAQAAGVLRRRAAAGRVAFALFETTVVPDGKTALHALTLNLKRSAQSSTTSPSRTCLILVRNKNQRLSGSGCTARTYELVGPIG